MNLSLRDVSPHQIIDGVRNLIGASVLTGLACLTMVYRSPLPQHALAQTGAAALLAAFLAAASVAAYAAVTDIDAPRRYRAKRR